MSISVNEFGSSLQKQGVARFQSNISHLVGEPFTVAMDRDDRGVVALTKICFPYRMANQR